jgi:hypothetical protein
MNTIGDEDFISSSEFFPCSCIGTCSGINVTLWTEIFDDKKVDYELLLSMYSKGHSNKFTLRDRLRFIWRIITCGHPYDDVVVLTNEDRKRLIKFLQIPDGYNYKGEEE